MKIKNIKFKNLIKFNKSLFLFIIFFFVFSLKISFGAEDSFGKGFTSTVKDLLNNITEDIISTIATLLMVSAFAIFAYGVVVFILGRIKEKTSLSELQKGKSFIKWGLIALFIMSSVWGIIKLAQNFLDLENSNIGINSVSFSSTLEDGSSDSFNKVTPSRASFEGSNADSLPPGLTRQQYEALKAAAAKEARCREQSGGEKAKEAIGSVLNALSGGTQNQENCNTFLNSVQIFGAAQHTIDLGGGESITIGGAGQTDATSILEVLRTGTHAVRSIFDKEGKQDKLKTIAFGMSDSQIEKAQKIAKIIGTNPQDKNNPDKFLIQKSDKNLPFEKGKIFNIGATKEEYIIQIKTYLNSIGCYGSIDSINNNKDIADKGNKFTADTKNSVIKYQIANSENPTGKVNFNLIQKMRSENQTYCADFDYTEIDL